MGTPTSTSGTSSVHGTYLNCIMTNYHSHRVYKVLSQEIISRVLICLEFRCCCSILDMNSKAKDSTDVRYVVRINVMDEEEALQKPLKVIICIWRGNTSSHSGFMTLNARMILPTENYMVGRIKKSLGGTARGRMMQTMAKDKELVGALQRLHLRL